MQSVTTLKAEQWYTTSFWAYICLSVKCDIKQVVYSRRKVFFNLLPVSHDILIHSLCWSFSRFCNLEKKHSHAVEMSKNTSQNQLEGYNHILGSVINHHVTENVLVSDTDTLIPYRDITVIQ